VKTSFRKDLRASVAPAADLRNAVPARTMGGRRRFWEVVHG